MHIELLEHHFTKAARARQRDTGFQSIAWSSVLAADQLNVLETMSTTSADLSLNGPCTYGFRMLGREPAWGALSQVCATAPFPGDPRANYYSRNVLVSLADLETLEFDIPALLRRPDLFTEPVLSPPEGGAQWKPRLLDVSEIPTPPKIAAFLGDIQLASFLDALLNAREGAPLRVFVPDGADPLALLASVWPAIPLGNRRRLSFRTLRDGRTLRYEWAVSFYIGDAPPTASGSIGARASAVDLRRTDGGSAHPSEYAQYCATQLRKGKLDWVQRRREPFDRSTTGLGPEAIELLMGSQRLKDELLVSGVCAATLASFWTGVQTLRKHALDSADTVWRQFEHEPWQFDAEPKAVLTILDLLEHFQQPEVAWKKSTAALGAWFDKADHWKDLERVGLLWAQVRVTFAKAAGPDPTRARLAGLCRETWLPCARAGLRFASPQNHGALCQILLDVLPCMDDKEKSAEIALELCADRGVSQGARNALLPALLRDFVPAKTAFAQQIAAIVRNLDCSSDTLVSCSSWLLNHWDSWPSDYDFLLAAAQGLRGHSTMWMPWIDAADRVLGCPDLATGIQSIARRWTRLVDATKPPVSLDKEWLVRLAGRLLREFAGDLHGRAANVTSADTTRFLSAILTGGGTMLDDVDSCSLWRLLLWTQEPSPTVANNIETALAGKLQAGELPEWIRTLHTHPVIPPGIMRAVHFTAEHTDTTDVRLAWLQYIANAPAARFHDGLLAEFSRLFAAMYETIDASTPPPFHAEAWDNVGILLRAPGTGTSSTRLVNPACQLPSMASLAALPPEVATEWLKPPFEALAKDRQALLTLAMGLVGGAATSHQVEAVCKALQPVLKGKITDKHWDRLLEQLPSYPPEKFCWLLEGLAELEWETCPTSHHALVVWNVLTQHGSQSGVLRKGGALVNESLKHAASLWQGDEMARVFQEALWPPRDAPLLTSCASAVFGSWLDTLAQTMRATESMEQAHRLWRAVDVAMELDPLRTLPPFKQLVVGLSRLPLLRGVDSHLLQTLEKLDGASAASLQDTIQWLLETALGPTTQSWFKAFIAGYLIRQPNWASVCERKLWIELYGQFLRHTPDTRLVILWCRAGYRLLVDALLIPDPRAASEILPKLKQHLLRMDRTRSGLDPSGDLHNACRLVATRGMRKEQLKLCTQVLDFMHGVDPQFEGQLGSDYWDLTRQRSFKKYRSRVARPSNNSPEGNPILLPLLILGTVLIVFAAVYAVLQGMNRGPGSDTRNHATKHLPPLPIPPDDTAAGLSPESAADVGSSGTRTDSGMFQPKSPADLSAILTPEDRVANRPAVPTPPLAASSPGSKTNAAAVQWVKYTVKANESLGAIAKANGCQLVDLAKTNNISNLDLIKEGEEILIPSRNSSHTRVPE